MKKTILITGANRGLGLGLTKFFIDAAYQVIATARAPDRATELNGLATEYPGQLQIETLDVASDLSVKALASKLEHFKSLDILINNAGVFLDGGKSLLELETDVLQSTMNVNLCGPFRMAKAFIPLLLNATNPCLVNITSLMGSIADNSGGGAYAYRTSKAALNMLNKSISIDYPKLTSVVMHPGWVATDMGGKQAPTDVEESTIGMGRVILELSNKDSGTFYNYQGEKLPW